MPYLCGAGGGTQDPIHAGQPLYQVSCIASLDFLSINTNIIQVDRRINSSNVSTFPLSFTCFIISVKCLLQVYALEPSFKMPSSVMV